MVARSSANRPTRASRRECLWHAPDRETAVAALLAAFPRGAVQWLTSRVELLHLHDTYDYDLASAGMALVRRGRSLLLCPAGFWQTRRALARQVLTRLPGPGQPLDLSGGPIPKALRGRAGARRLLPVATVPCSVVPGVARSPDGGRLARVAIETYEPVPGLGCGAFTLLRVSMAADARKRMAALGRRLEKAGLSCLSRTDIRCLLHRLVPVPARAALRPRAPAAPKDPARLVVLRLVQALLAAMRRYEDGIRRDLDPECLHQYRVLLRRLRTLVSQMRRVLPEDLATLLRDSLQDVARRTGRLRDLDVMLQAEPAYRRMVPEALLPRLCRAFAAARRQRGLESGRLARTLQSRRYAALLAGLQEALAVAVLAPASSQRAEAIGRYVRKRICRQYRRIIHDAAELRPETPSAELHRIRIRCKRLRYLVDLFQELLSREPVAVLLRRLQALQDALGAINDLAMQRAHLGEWLSAGAPGAIGAPPPVLAELQDRLDRRRQALDCRARALLLRFCSRSTARTVGRL